MVADDRWGGRSTLNTRREILPRLRDLGRDSAERWVGENLAAVGSHPTVDLANFARPSVELHAEDGGMSPQPG